MWGTYGWGMPGYFGWGGMLIGFVLLVGLVAAVFAIVRYFLSSDRHVSKNENALEILKKRYARGEITQEEFVKIRDDLKE